MKFSRHIKIAILSIFLLNFHVFPQHTDTLSQFDDAGQRIDTAYYFFESGSLAEINVFDEASESDSRKVYQHDKEIEYAHCTFGVVEHTNADFPVISDDNHMMSSEQDELKQRLKQIRTYFSNCPNIQLPWSYSLNSNPANACYSTNLMEDTLVFGTKGPYRLIGTLKDTSSFYGIFYFTIGDDYIPEFRSYDKTGNLIEQVSLLEGCWQGCESDCRSSVSIDETLKISTRFEFYLYQMYFNDNDELVGCSEYPMETSGYVQKSHIDNAGKLVVDEKETLPLKELLRNPIIHKQE